MSWIFTIITLLMSVHKTLYAPVFAPLPFVGRVEAKAQESLTLPVKRLTSTQLPPIEAGAFLVIDQESGEVLAENNADVPLAPASTTKIMTAIVALEKMEPERVVTVPEDLEAIGSKMELQPGEQIKIIDLVTGLLVHSSNDAAQMLAYSFDGGEEAFISAMNLKASELNLTKTHFENPSGLGSPGHLTTVRDLLILSRYAMKNEKFREIVKLEQATIKSVDSKIVHEVETTNKLLGQVEGIEGVKTGWTEEAGECLVTQVTRDGHTILTALLRSPDRFRETKELINWVYEGFYWETKTLDEWQK